LTWSTYRKERADFRQEGKTMTNTKSNRMKKLAAGVTMTFVLGGGAAAVLLPTFASATVASHGTDDPAGHVKGGKGADDGLLHAKNGVDDGAHKKHTADDGLGHAKNGVEDGAHKKHTADDGLGHAKNGVDDAVGHQRHTPDGAGHA
jgi:hypothetical protein